MAKTVVVKIGSNVLADSAGNIDVVSAKRLLRQLHELQRCGFNIVAVVSGAVQFGKDSFKEKHAAAALGQVRLMQAFGNVGQMLLCKKDLEDVEVRKNALITIQVFWKQGLMVLVNENDVVELNSFGGNDFLALEVARLVGAEEIVLLSTVDGFLDKHKQVVKQINIIDQQLQDLVDDRMADGVGGMRAKLQVAQKCLREGRRLIIVNGKRREILTQMFLKHKVVGTVFSKEGHGLH